MDDDYEIISHEEVERLKKGLEFEYKMYKNRSEIYD